MPRKVQGMPKDKGPKPSIATYGDYEMITPHNPLRGAVRQISPGEAADDPVARAEEALASLSSEFTSWMDSECERLDAARRTIKADGFNKKTLQALFHAAHDIKGDAVTFGFPSAGAAAESLCRIIEHAPELAKVPSDLIMHHINAVQAIVRQRTKLDTAAMASELSRQLRGIADEFLTRANQDRPEHLEAIMAPSIAPAE